MKPIPYRHRPKGLTILYKDSDIIVIDKSSGLLTVKATYEKEKTAHHILTNYIRKGSLKSTKQLFVVHRLDSDTSGVLVFAKSSKVKENLKLQWKNVKKKYVAVVHGILTEKGEAKSRLALHSHYLTFKHPHSGKELTFEAEVPVFFKNYFDKI